MIGPYFFEDEMGTALTVTGDHYEQWHLQWSARWWIKNGAFGSNRMVQPATLQGNHWLASDNCSPDGWFPDMETFLGHPGLQIWQLQIFFLWGYLKERIHQTKPRTLQKLQDSIRGEILSIQQETDISDGVCGTVSTALCGSPWQSLTASNFQDIICEQSPTCALSFPPYIFCKSYFFFSVLLFEI
jgi:hypothetical protein